jgi:hypothetical protein
MAFTEMDRRRLDLRHAEQEQNARLKTEGQALTAFDRDFGVPFGKKVDKGVDLLQQGATAVGGLLNPITESLQAGVSGLGSPTPSSLANGTLRSEGNVGAPLASAGNSVPDPRSYQENPVPREGDSQLEAVIADNPGEDKEEAQVRKVIIGQAVKQGEETGEKSPELKTLLESNPNASAEAVAEARSTDLSNTVKSGEGANWSESEMSAWDNFNSMYDLTTVGLNLMAMSQNGESLTVSLGKALSAGKQAKEAQVDKDVANERLDRKEGREERKLDIDEAEGLSKDKARGALDRNSAADRASREIIADKNNQSRLEAAELVADGGLPTATHQAQLVSGANGFLQNQGMHEDRAGGHAVALATETTNIMQQYGVPYQQAQQEAFEWLIETGVIQKSKWHQSGDVR